MEEWKEYITGIYIYIKMYFVFFFGNFFCIHANMNMAY